MSMIYKKREANKLGLVKKIIDIRYERAYGALTFKKLNRKATLEAKMYPLSIFSAAS